MSLNTQGRHHAPRDETPNGPRAHRVRASFRTESERANGSPASEGAAVVFGLVRGRTGAECHATYHAERDDYFNE